MRHRDHFANTSRRLSYWLARVSHRVSRVTYPHGGTGSRKCLPYDLIGQASVIDGDTAMAGNLIFSLD